MNVHSKVVKRILRYLKGTTFYGLLIQPNNTLSIIAFLDADWASNIDDCKSVLVYCVFLLTSLVFWSSKKQLVVARSSTKTEYCVLAHAFVEITWICHCLKNSNLAYLEDRFSCVTILEPVLLPPA